MKLETLAIHAGRAPDPASGAVAPSPVLSTTFARDADGDYPHGHIYSRAGNPGRTALETLLAALEGGAAAAALPAPFGQNADLAAVVLCSPQ